MANFGFIGFGSMAKMIIRSFIEFSGISPSNIYVTRKSKDKLHEIGDAFKGVNAVESCRDVAENAQVIFLCAKPLEIKEVLAEILPFVNSDTHIISIAGSVSVENLQSVFCGKITKYMPTIVSEVGAGISLIYHNEFVTAEDAALLEDIISRFSKIKHVKNEDDWGFASELTSCMPGFIASIFDYLTNAAQNHTESFSRDEINELVTETLYGTAKLLSETGMSFAQTVSRVATKGGITAEGVSVFERSLPGVFDEMFERTLAKRRFVVGKIEADFQNNEG